MASVQKVLADHNNNGGPNEAYNSSSAKLASAKADTGATDFVDTQGFGGRMYVHIHALGAAGGTVKIEQSHNGEDWIDAMVRADPAATWAATPVAVAGNAVDGLFLEPETTLRFVRANVTVAAANGLDIEFWGERR